MNEQTRQRQQNRAAILQCLHLNGPIQRSTLSRTCRIRKTSVSRIVDELQAAGMVALADPSRARSPVTLNPSGPHVLCSALTIKAACAC